MATADIPNNTTNAPRRSRRRKTSHLKEVPQPKELRERIRVRCRDVADRLDKDCPLSKDEMERVAREILTEMELPESFVGWTMVVLSTAFWQDQVAAIPPSRRLFLLPHCLKHAEGCPADYDEFGLDCEKCGACSIADFRSTAEKMGYKVLVAEGSPIVLKIIVSGHVDAITGVACLNVLEKAIDKILLAGIPCAAVPLLSSDCRNTSVDEDWVHEMIQLRSTVAGPSTRTYLHLMRAAKEMFQPEELDRLVPRSRTLNGHEATPLAFTENQAIDFLSKGGKYSRPFITLAVHDALTGARATMPQGDAHLAALNDSVKRAAMAIEVFHKASLIHDDIEDEDAHRYGEPTLHNRFGVPTAINLGDYLVGLGYRLVSAEASELGAEVAADILNALASAHQKLAEGQGSELVWRDASDKRLTPIDALKIYALKTSPAFEAALYSGARLAGSAADYVQPIKQFARNLGVGFQILNDLKDWRGDEDNKLTAAGDILGGRPTLLLALALEALSDEEQTILLELLSDNCQLADGERIRRVRKLYEQAGVFAKAHRLVDKHVAKAEAVADEIQPDELRRLFYYLVDTVLEREEEPVTVVQLANAQVG